MSQYTIKGFLTLKVLTSIVIISLLLAGMVVVAHNQLTYNVTIHSHGLIRRFLEYYVCKNENTYQLLDSSNNVIEEGSDFSTLVNDAVSLVENAGLGTVYICEGVHIASSPIMLASNVALKGMAEDPGKVVIKQGDNQLWYPGVIGIVEASNVEIAYLTVDMTGTPLVNGSSWPLKGNGISFRDDDNNNGNIHIHDVRVLNAGCYGIKTHFGSNITIHDVYIEGAWWDCMNIASTNVTIRNVEGTNWGDVGIAMFRSKYGTVENCFLHDAMEPPGGGSSGVFGFTIEGLGAEQVVVTNVTVSNAQYGFAVYTGTKHLVANCTVTDVSANVLGGNGNNVTNCRIINGGHLEIRGVGNKVLNCTFVNTEIATQDNPSDFQIIGNEIVNADNGIWFWSSSSNVLIQGNHIYCNTTPPITEYAIDLGYHTYNVNITIIYNDFTYNGIPNFKLGVLNLEESTNINLIIENNIGYP